MTGLIVALDALVVAPLFERSYAMFRSAIGTWIPFAAISAAAGSPGLRVGRSVSAQQRHHQSGSDPERPPAAGYDYNMDWTPCVGGTFTRWNGS